MATLKQRCSDWLEENAHKIMLVFMIVETAALLFYTVYMFGSLDTHYEYLHFQLYKWLCLVILTVYLFYLYFHAVVRENSVELVAFLVISAIVNGNSFYRIFSYMSSAQQESRLIINSQLAGIILSIISQAAYFVLAFPIHKKFGWRRYNLFGTNPRKINMYKQFQLFQTLVKTSMVLSGLICTTIFFTYYWSNMIVFCVNIFLTLTLITNHLMGSFSARYEEATLFRSFRIIQVVTELYKIVMTFMITETMLDGPRSQSHDETLTSAMVLALSFMIVSTPLTLSILFLGYRVAQNFQEGIKDILDKETESENQNSYSRLP